MSLNGNVLNFGPANMNQGVINASPYIQDAMDSDYAVFFPPGIYNLESEVQINKVKTIECFGRSLVTGWDDGAGVNNPIRTEEQVRFTSQNNINFFRVNKEQIHWRGGCFDAQPITNHDKAIFYYALGFWWKEGGSQYGRAEGWGGGVYDAVGLGNVATLRGGPTGGTKMIEIHFPAEVEWPEPDLPSFRTAYITSHIFGMQCYGMDTCWYVDDRKVNQWNNTNHIRVRASHCRRTIYNESGVGCQFFVRHDAANIFDSASTAANTPSIYSSSQFDENMFYHPRFINFQSGSDGGYYYNEKTIDDTGGNFWYGLNDDDITNAIALSSSKEFQLYNSLRFREGGQFTGPTATTAQLDNANSSVNGSNKRGGTAVWNSDLERPVYATGSSSTSSWEFSDGTPAHNPST